MPETQLTGVQLMPKFMAAFMGTAVQKVCCGQHFTICLTEAGEVYTFGEGQSGQLGTGRCSKRVLPEKVLDCAPTNEAPIVDCTAGWAHAMCLSSSGDIFVWGFNLYGQLGLGDNKTRFHPEPLVCNSPGFQVRPYHCCPSARPVPAARPSVSVPVRPCCHVRRMYMARTGHLHRIPAWRHAQWNRKCR